MQARDFCCWRVVGGKRGIGEHVGSLMHRRKSQSGVSSVKPFSLRESKLTSTTGLSPWTRFSMTSPSNLPAFLARSCACIQVLSSVMVAIEYTELEITYQLATQLPLRVWIYLQRQTDSRKVSIEQGSFNDFFLD